jgi:hypothetical protein
MTSRERVKQIEAMPDYGNGTAATLRKTPPLNSNPTALKEPDALLIIAAPAKLGGNWTNSSTNLAVFERAGTETFAVATCCPESFTILI